MSWNETTIPDEFSGGDMNYLESYQELNVDNTIRDIQIDATNLVTQLCNMYLKNDLISNEDHVKAVAAIEIRQLSSAMMAVRSVEHALQTLMRQLDAGGYANESIFDQINTLSKTSMDLTIKSTQYLRSLPEYLKFTATEMQEQGLMQAVEILQTGADNAANDDNGEDSTFSLSGPITGTRELMLQIRDEEHDLDKLIDEAKTQQSIVEQDNLRESNDDKSFTEFEEE
jgi:hypothetical protein